MSFEQLKEKKLKQRAKESAVIRSNDPKITRIFQVTADSELSLHIKYNRSQIHTDTHEIPNHSKLQRMCALHSCAISTGETRYPFNFTFHSLYSNETSKIATYGNITMRAEKNNIQSRREKDEKQNQRSRHLCMQCAVHLVTKLYHYVIVVIWNIKKKKRK